MVKAILSSQKTTDVLPLSGGTMTGPITLNGAPTEDLHASTKRYVDDAKATAASDAQSKATKALNDAKSYTDEKTAGLTGAMHFRGTVTSIPPSGSYASGDVVLNGNKEYVYDGKDWKELGDEGSYVLKTQKINNHALSGDISLTAADVGARPSTWMPTASQVGADPAGTAAAVQTALQQEIDSKASTQALNDGLTKKQDKITASGILKGDGAHVAQAIAGTDYLPAEEPEANGRMLIKSNFGITPELQVGGKDWSSEDTRSKIVLSAGTSDVSPTIFVYDGPAQNKSSLSIKVNSGTTQGRRSGILLDGIVTPNSRVVSKYIAANKAYVDALRPTIQKITLTQSGWGSESTQTVTCTGIVTDETKQVVCVDPAVADFKAYCDAGCYVSGIAADQLIFTCATAPGADLTVYVSIQNVG